MWDKFVEFGEKAKSALDVIGVFAAFSALVGALVAWQFTSQRNDFLSKQVADLTSQRDTFQKIAKDVTEDRDKKGDSLAECREGKARAVGEMSLLSDSKDELRQCRSERDDLKSKESISNYLISLLNEKRLLDQQYATVLQLYQTSMSSRDYNVLTEIQYRRQAAQSLLEKAGHCQP